MTSSPPSSSSTSITPPPLPISLITTLLPHLLPPSPLPQELLCGSLLQRLMYLPPSPSDLDSFLSPFPSNESQPISSRLQELSHGHRLGEIGYTKEGDEVYAKIDILPEHEQEGSIEAWFEFEYSQTSPSESRGWVYHSSRIPQSSTEAIHKFVSTPELLSTLVEESQPTQINDQDGDDRDNQQAPEGYWTAFDSPPSTNSTSLPYTDIDPREQEEHHEDAYWAQYSRPATAPITPGIHTPFHPNDHTNAKSPLGNNTMNSQEEQARKLTESLNQLGLNHLNNDLKNGYSKVGNGNQEGKRGFWVDEAHPLDENHEQAQVQVKGTQTETAVIEKPVEEEEEETGKQVKDRLKAMISLSLSELWKEHIKGSSELDLEVKAMEWLNFGKKVDEHDQRHNNNEINGLYEDAYGKNTIIVGKLEILWEMYQVIRKNSNDEFFRLIESVIKKSPDYRNQEDFDDVMIQNNYYE